MNEPPITTAIAQLKRRDLRGLTVVVNAFQVRALRTADLITRDVALAQDVVSNAFVKVVERIHQYESTRPFEAWLLRMVINDALKVATRHQTRSLEEEQINGVVLMEVIPDPSPDPLEQVITTEFKQAVWEALGHLSAEQRTVIVLKYYLGYSEADIGEALNCPLSTVKGRLYSARQRLRPWLQPLVQGSEVIHE